MWGDESVTFQLAHRNLPQIWRTTQKVDLVHAFHYTVMHEIYGLVGGGLLTLRLPSVPGPRRVPGSPRLGVVDRGSGPRKQVNTAPVDHGVLYASRSTKVPCSSLHHLLSLFPRLTHPAWRPSVRLPHRSKSVAWLPSSSRSPTREGLAGCVTGSPRCWPWWSAR
jgi:hypothetical protein